MAGKIGKIVLDAVLALIFFLTTAILIDWVASKIFGTTVNPDGTHTVNFNGGVLLAMTTVLTIVFAVWFYKYVHFGRKNEAKKIDE